MDIIGIIGNTVAGRKGFYETKRGEKSQRRQNLLWCAFVALWFKSLSPNKRGGTAKQSKA